MSRALVSIRADRELRKGLAFLAPNSIQGVGLTQEAADLMLARVVWSHLVEPGDAVAAALINSLGVRKALDLIASQMNARAICAAMSVALAIPEDALPVSAQQVSAGMKRWLPRLDREGVLAEISLAADSKAQVVVPGTAEWPESLNDLGPHAPVLLWVRGNTSCLAQTSLAVVGARACSNYGTHVTAELASDACAAGVVIVSGAAYGIDAVAHRAALAAEASTVAVLAGGVERPYPAAHGALLEKIVSTGAVCSEVVPGTAPTRWRFLQRNRIIAALAQATLVTEAGPRSGSLNTAGHSAEIGRPLGAVPGPITNPASLGCHRLIREYGATLVSNGAELRELLGLRDLPLLGDSEPLGAHAGDIANSRESPVHLRVVDALPLRGGRTAVDVARLAGVAVEEVSAALAELELLGRVVRRETPERGEVHWSQKRGE